MKMQFTTTTVLFLALASAAVAQNNPPEVYCTIRDKSTSLNCQWVNGENRRTMTAEDIPTYIDGAQAAAYMVVKSRKGFERVFFIDGAAPQFKKLADTTKSSSIFEINRAKGELFGEIEKMAIKASDDLDIQAAASELVKIDPSIAYDKSRRESRKMVKELEGFRKNSEKVCTSTPAFEQMSKANASLQQTLSNILFALQQPDSCMSDFKVFRDRDGTVDLRQLDNIATKFAANCKKK